MAIYRDYIIDMIRDFCRVMCELLFRGCISHQTDAAQSAEERICDLLQLDRETALSLSPESLVRMMRLSGVSYSVAAYVAYSLDRLADGWEEMGQQERRDMRRAQAEAVAAAYDCDLLECPVGLEPFDEELAKHSGS